MKIGVICPADIALRRFMPALRLCDDLEFAGVGVYTKEERLKNRDMDDEIFRAFYERETVRAQVFINQYGGKIFEGYEAVVNSDEIEMVYIPLPPALHYEWAKKALEKGKHVLVEKPATISRAQTEELICLANKKSLAFHENYMFTFHDQLDAIDEMIKQGMIGDIRLYRICFGFPRKAVNDFRYDRTLGGGALFDAGGYALNYAYRLLGPTATLKYAQSNYLNEFEVDIYGSAALVNDAETTAQIAFGMDNNYKCELEVWGSKGCLTTDRIFTAPVGYIPTVVIRNGNEERTIKLPADDAFLKSIRHFLYCIQNGDIRKERYQIIEKQAVLVEEFQMLAGWHTRA